MRKSEHPSDLLYQGRVTDFGHALDLVQQEWALEYALAARGADDEAVSAMQTSHASILAAVVHAGRVWREEQERARQQTIIRLRETVTLERATLNDEEYAEWLGLLADALDDSDYSRLAI